MSDDSDDVIDEQKKIVAECIRKGLDGFIGKPFNEETARVIQLSIQDLLNQLISIGAVRPQTVAAVKISEDGLSVEVAIVPDVIPKAKYLN